MVDKAEAGESSMVLIGLAIGSAVATLLLVLAITLAQPAPSAQGGALTHVTNVSVGKLSTGVTVRQSNGVLIDIGPQQDVWGARSIVVRNGTKVAINNSTKGPGEYGLASGSNNIVRRVP